MPPLKRLKTEVSRLAINACPAMSDHAAEPEEQCNCPKQCKLSTRTDYPVRHKSLSWWECMGRGGGLILLQFFKPCCHVLERIPLVLKFQGGTRPSLIIFDCFTTSSLRTQTTHLLGITDLGV